MRNPRPKSRRTRRLFTRVFAASLALPAVTNAQAPKAVVEEILVTAQKREQSLQDVPISVVALSAEMMESSNIQDMEDVASFTPNLSVFSMPPFTSLSVRGLGSPFDKGFEHSAGLFLDGVYVGRLAFLDSAFLDVQSVEVLRGPQGTLFGKNTISGALSIRSVQPNDEFMVSLEAQTGDRDLEKYTLLANLPLTDSLAMRLAYAKGARDGAVYNTTLDRQEGSNESENYRLSARWDISDTVNITASSTHIDQNYNLGQFQVQTATNEQFQLMQFYDDQVERNPKDFQSSQDFAPQAPQKGEKHDVSVNFEWWEHEFSLINSLSGITEVSETDLDFSPIPLLYFLNGEDYRQTSHELRIVSPLGMLDGKLDYVGGIYYAESDTDIQVIIDAAPEPADLLAGLAANNGLGGGDIAATTVAGQGPGERLFIESFQRGTSTALYGQASWHFTDTFNMTIGLRYSKEKKSVFQQQDLDSGPTDTPGPVFTQAVMAEEYTLDKTRVDESISPKFAIGWEATDNITTYASIAAGFKSGGFSGSAVRAEIAEVEPESSTTYEIGTKMRLLDGAATANIAAFYTEFEDLQLTVFEGSTSRISNAAGAISEGLEFDGQFVSPWGISGSLSMAYLKARFTEYKNGPCPAGTETPCDLTGKPLANAPTLKGNFSINYQNDLGDLPLNLLVGADYLYKDDILLNVDQDPIDRQSAYSTVNLRLRIGDDDENWSVQALVRNATDKHALDGSGDIPTLTGAHFARAINPRELDITIKYRF